MPNQDVRETRLRDTAHARGYRLIRSPHPNEGYLVVDADRDSVVLGSEPTAFSATIDAVESFLMDGAVPRQRRRLAVPDFSV